MLHELTPRPATIVAIERQVPDHRLFRLEMDTPLAIAPGQFVELSVPGIGGFPVSTAGLGDTKCFEACIRRTGRVTDSLFRLQEGSRVGLRGPLGQGFRLEAFDGRDALLLAGGLGMAPLRGLLLALLQRDRCRRILLLYGARTPELLLFRDELVALQRQGRIELRFAVDFAEPLPGDGVYCRVGLVTELLADLHDEPAMSTAAVCGPPLLYDCLLEALAARRIPADYIFATLERRMQCGVGHCCHCVVSGVAVCREGPVFSLERLRQIPGAIGGAP